LAVLANSFTCLAVPPVAPIFPPAVRHFRVFD